MAGEVRRAYPDPGALQRQVDQIVDAPPVVRGYELVEGAPYQGTGVTSPELGERAPARRGTTNGNVRGGSKDRERATTTRRNGS
jgi:hypothetical protein